MVQTVIEARGLTKHYGPTVGVEELGLVVEKGEVFGFLGPNGAGKTTTIRLLLDLIRPTRGTATILGRPTGDPETRRRVGYLPGELSLDPRLTGRETLLFFGHLHGMGESQDAHRRRAGICEALGLRGDDLARPVRDYSRGMKQKLGLVSALQHDPELLILDEPTTGLDPFVREAVLGLIQQAGREGRTVFHSSHVLTEVERSCTRVGILRSGRLVLVERIDTIRRATVRWMVVRFEVEVPAEELTLSGVQVIEQDGHRFVLRVSGALDPLLGVLARHRVAHMAFPEPGLEEAFVELYRDTPRAAR